MTGSQGILRTAAFRALRFVSMFYLPSLIDLLCILPQALISVQGADPDIRYCYLRSGSGYLYVQDEAGWM